MSEALICDAVRTPIGRYGGALSSIRTDDLGAIPIAALLERNANLNPVAIEDLAYGCANQAGEDNRNVARMSLLLAGMPVTVPAVTVNRLCGSGMNAIGNIADGIRTGVIQLGIAGGVESMSRAPFVMPKQTAAFGRSATMYDTTLGWRFVNKKLEAQYGIDSMAETAENVADGFLISREDQDQFALRSQQRAEAASAAGNFGWCHNDAATRSSWTKTNIRATGRRSKDWPGSGLSFAKVARSRPVTRRESTMARVRCLSPTKMPQSHTGLIRLHAFWVGQPPA
jgi:acetyl-CoA acetyltransferase